MCFLKGSRRGCKIPDYLALLLLLCRYRSEKEARAQAERKVVLLEEKVEQLEGMNRLVAK